MSNTEIIAKFVERLSKRIEWRMELSGDSYAKVKAKIVEESVAGPAVWVILDAKFE